MAVTLRAVSTAVPPTILVQGEVRDVFAAQPGLNRLAQRIIGTAFDVSGIATRHTVLEELSWEARPEEPVFFDVESGELRLPGTKARNEIYAVEATRLYLEAARGALEACAGVEASDITHVVTVSCTGFYAPGPDFMLARDLGLDPGVERYHLGFMGCYASIPALRMAKQLCEADASAVVLVVSAELCTLHLRSSNDPDTIVASSLFADGAAAGIVSTRPAEPGERAFDLDGFATRVTPVGEGDMAWKIGDHGFEMVLSNAVPAIIDDHITGALEPLFASEPALATALADDTALRRGRALGDPPRRAQHPRQGRVAARAHRGATRSGARDPARLRQHVECDGAVRVEEHPRVAGRRPTATGWPRWRSGRGSRSNRRC